jgi:hypothetical protein
MVFFVLKKELLEEYLDLLKLILPTMLVEHFDLTKSQQLAGKLNLYFEEKNDIPLELNSRQLISKGFHNEVIIQDFPLRGQLVFLHVKRRRWTDKQTKEILQRDWNVVAKGTRMTKEFASFLKEINQY